MRSNLDEFTWHVMDATADDWESIDQITPHVKRFLDIGDSGQILDAVTTLLHEGLLEEMPGEAGWYRMTAVGRALWDFEGHKYRE